MYNLISIITQTPIPSGPPRSQASGLYLRNTSIPLIPFRLTTRGKQIFDLPRQGRSIFTSLSTCNRTITTLDITSHSIQDTHTFPAYKHTVPRRNSQQTVSLKTLIFIRDSMRFCEHVVPRPASGFETCFPSRAWNLKITQLRFQRKTKQGT